VAVNLAQVFPEFERRYTPNYSRQSIQELIENSGGESSTQKFVKTRQEELDYIRSEAEFNRRDIDITEDKPFCAPPRRPTRSRGVKCHIIPGVVAAAAGWEFEELAVSAPIELEPEPTENTEITPSSTPETTETTFTPIETEEIENCLHIAETAAAASPEAVSTAWQMLRQLPDERLKRAVWHRLSVAARNAMQKAKESDRLGTWERAA
jgi:hypothetical protein